MEKEYVSCFYCHQYLNINKKDNVYVCDGNKGCKNRNFIKYVSLSYLNDKSPYAYKCMSPQINNISIIN